MRTRHPLAVQVGEALLVQCWFHVWDTGNGNDLLLIRYGENGKAEGFEKLERVLYGVVLGKDGFRQLDSSGAFGSSEAVVKEGATCEQACGPRPKGGFACGKPDAMSWNDAVLSSCGIFGYAHINDLCFEYVSARGHSTRDKLLIAWWPNGLVDASAPKRVRRVYRMYILREPGGNEAHIGPAGVVIRGERTKVR